MVQGKKDTAKKSRRKLAVKKESLKDLPVKNVQKVKGGAVPGGNTRTCAVCFTNAC